MLAVTFLAIYRQLRLQRAANAFDHLSRLMAEWGSERLLRAKIAVGLALQRGESVPYGPGTMITDYWDTLGGLVRHGFLDDRVVYEAMGRKLMLWYALLGEDDRRIREQEGDDAIDANFEWLAGVFARFAVQGGKADPLDRARALSALDEVIAAYQESLRIAEDSRSIPVGMRRDTGSPRAHRGPAPEGAAGTGG